MYTIKQAAGLSGVGISLLRAWERRYGIVVPERTASGYRLYDDAAIARLRAMRQLVEAGWTASQAAEAVIIAPPSTDDPDSFPLPVVVGGVGADLGAFVNAAAAYDAAGLESVLDALFGRGSYEAVIDDLVLPAMAAFGSGWVSGRIDVAAEHLASAALQRRLATLFDLGGAPGSGPSVLVGLPPGSRHEIGPLAYAVALRRRGVNVLYLGPDTPVASWVHAGTESSAVAATIAVARPADIGPALEVGAALSAMRPSFLVTLGGPSAPDVGGVGHVLPLRVTDAAAAMARLVGLA